jgi:hypothetical protein
VVEDQGLRPGVPSTRFVADIGARAVAGHQFRVAERRGDWLGVWNLGDIGWLHGPPDDPKVVPVPPQEQSQVVVPRGKDPIPVYGEALPDP